MKREECAVGTLVDVIAAWTVDDAIDRYPAIIVQAPRGRTALCGIAVRMGDTWIPRLVSPALLRPRTLADEPASMAAARMERCQRYEQLLAAATSLPGFQAVQAAADLRALEREAGDAGYTFERGSDGHYRLVEMADCEFDMFVAATEVQHGAASLHLTAHWREPLSTMERRPAPPHIAAQGPCGGCGSPDPQRWRWHRRDQLWLCQCYWYPELRPRYQPARPAQPRQSQLPVATGSPLFMCNLNARPGHRCQVILPGDEEAWWTK